MEKQEFEQKVLDIARITRVVAGGKRFRFRAVVVIGNGRGRVGVGAAKAGDVAAAVQKAAHQAKKNLISVLLKNKTIAYETRAKYGSSKVILKPAKIGHGLVAGGVVRTICELSGIENISAKILTKSKNKLNNARATIEALLKLATSK